METTSLDCWVEWVIEVDSALGYFMMYPSNPARSGSKDRTIRKVILQGSVFTR